MDIIDFKNTSNEQSKLDKQWYANTWRSSNAHEYEYDAISSRTNVNAKHASYATTRLNAIATTNANAIKLKPKPKFHQ